MRHVRFSCAGICLGGLLCGCASYSGRDLQPGVSVLADVRAAMGQPAAQWSNPDGSMQLSYPRGPAGYHWYMVYLDGAGRFQRRKTEMDEASFRRISKGMTESEGVRVLIPPWPTWPNCVQPQRDRVVEWHIGCV